MTPAQVAAIVACVVLAGLAVFQALLVAGRPLGRFAWGGQHEVLPRNLKIGSAVSIGLYAAFAAVVLDRTGLVELMPDAVSGIAVWVLAAYGALGIVMNAVSRSRPERFTMTPVAAVLAACFLVVALG